MTEIVLGDPIHFYNGEVTLQFDEKGHEYYLVSDKGLEVQDGVTRACGILDHSIYLMPWAVKMMYLKLLSTMPRTGDKTVSIPWADFDQILQEAKKAHKEHFEDAGDVGHLAHKWIEDSIRWAITFNNGIVEQMNEMAPTDERAVSCGIAAHKWMVAHNVRWIRTERKVYSRKYKYAGTMDGLAMVDGCTDRACCPSLFLDQLSLVDWKSSNHLRIEYLFQTAGYQQAEQEEFGCEIAARWILRLGKEDGKFEAWYETNFEQDFHAFLCCLTLQRANAAVDLRMREAKKLRTFKKREEAKKVKEKVKFEKRRIKDAASN